MSESVGDGGLDEFGGMVKPAASGREMSRSGCDRSDREMSLRAKGTSATTGDSGADTQGTTLVTTLARKDGLAREEGLRDEEEDEGMMGVSGGGFLR